jgi:hypothetical protein
MTMTAAAGIMIGMTGMMAAITAMTTMADVAIVGEHLLGSETA